MDFIVDRSVIDLGVVIRGVEILELDNEYYPEELKVYIQEHVAQLLEEISKDHLQDSIIQGFYDLHQKVGVPKRKNIPASENLLKSLLKHKELYSINPVVDIYNLISMESRLALGAHDIDHINGNMNLKITNGLENFVPLGQSEAKKVKEGIYSYIDDSQDILCYLEVRQVDKTKITEKSENVFYIVQGNENTTQEYVDKVARKLIDITTFFLGGTGRFLSSGR